MDAILVTFRNHEGRIDSQVVYVRPGYTNRATLTLLMLLPQVDTWVEWSPLVSHDAVPSGALRKSLVRLFMDGMREDSIVLEHNSPVEKTEHVRGIEQNIRVALELDGPVCVVACEPIYEA